MWRRRKNILLGFHLFWKCDKFALRKKPVETKILEIRISVTVCINWLNKIAVMLKFINFFISWNLKIVSVLWTHYYIVKVGENFIRFVRSSLQHMWQQICLECTTILTFSHVRFDSAKLARLIVGKHFWTFLKRVILVWSKSM